MNSQEHLQVTLSEELIEVALGAAQLVSKGLRFGLDDRNVLHPTGPTNRERLVVELNDLMGVIEMCVQHGIIPGDWEKGVLKAGKQKRVREFMEYARRKGALQLPGETEVVMPKEMAMMGSKLTPAEMMGEKVPGYFETGKDHLYPDEL